jgi:DNA polymerase I
MAIRLARVTDVPGALRAAGLAKRGELAAVVVAGAGIGLASERETWTLVTPRPAAALAAIEGAVEPRWVWWSARGIAASLAGDVPAVRWDPAACWDVAAVHRLLHGGRRDDPAVVWAAARGLPPPAGLGPPVRGGQLDLLAAAEDAAGGDDPDAPVRPDGQLRRDWADEHWTRAAGGDPGRRADRAARWARLAWTVSRAQESALRDLPEPRAAPGATPLAVLTARAESAADLLARELERDGLPLDRRGAEEVIARAAGPRPRDAADEARLRRHRDTAVLTRLPAVDPRNPVAVRAALRAVGIDVPDTRSWRLEPLRAAHPAVAELLSWRKAERMATTYGYRWLDTFVGPDSRLRGGWRGSDGAAGRMTAQAGLHNLPAELRVAVAAEPGHRLVRADLGQIEPRVLAVVSGDPGLRRATAEDDLYAPVARQLGCDRPTAKVAMLAAMYGQTSGAAGAVLGQMRQAYPDALAYLDAADADGRAGHDLRTFGGRLIRTAPGGPPGSEDWAAAAARGRFARNAVVQGAAAELFKAWAATVRGAARPLGGRIVLCLHDELLLHVPAGHAAAAAGLLRETLTATAGYWAAGSGVRFVADVSVLERWSDAKP